MSLSVQFLFNIQKQPHIQPPLCKGRCRTNVRRRDCEVDFIKSLSHFFISKNDSSLYKGAFDGQEQAPALRSHKFSISTNFSVWQQPLIAVYTNSYKSDAPSFSQSDSACPSGASLHITLSQTRLAPAALQSSSHASIHSPPPQPYEPKSAMGFPLSFCLHAENIGSNSDSSSCSQPIDGQPKAI